MSAIDKCIPVPCVLYMKISTVIIAKNEEKDLERCLQSIAPVSDEIVFVDTGSTDRTKDIAASYTSKIFDS